jgi:hypothetical protein
VIGYAHFLPKKREETLEKLDLCPVGQMQLYREKREEKERDVG